MSYSRPLVSFLMIFLSLIVTLNGSENSISDLIEKNHIYIESGSGKNKFISPYVFIVPVEDYFIFKSINRNKFEGQNLNVIENIKTEFSETARYQLDSGFAFFRKSSDYQYSSTTKEEITGKVEEILNLEANSRGLYFYDFKDKFAFINSCDVFCEGKIFSPSRKINQGYFFFRKLKPCVSSEHVCYIISYDYSDDYNEAKNKYEKIFGSIYLISDGCLNSYIP